MTSEVTAYGLYTHVHMCICTHGNIQEVEVRTIWRVRVFSAFN